MEEGTFVVGGLEAMRIRYRAVVTALYPDGAVTHAVAERLIGEGIPAEAISVVASEGDFKKSLEAGVCIIPTVEFDGVQQQGAFGGAFLGGAAGLLLGAELVLLGVGAVFALPALAGASLIGVAVGSTMGKAFSGMDLREEGTGYRMHLQRGGWLLVVYALDAKEADRIERMLLRVPPSPSEIGKHPLHHPTSP